MRRDTVYLREVMQVLGESVYGDMLEAFGGTNLYVPATAGAHHPITVIIGQEAANLLCARFAGDTLELPVTARKRALIKADLVAGIKPIPIARKYYCSVRYVQYIQAEMADQKPSQQLGLF